MRLVYSWHAKIRMKQRGVTEFEIEYILKYPINIINSTNNKKIAIGNIKNRNVKVVFIYKEDYIKIITIRF